MYAYLSKLLQEPIRAMMSLFPSKLSKIISHFILTLHIDICLLLTYELDGIIFKWICLYRVCTIICDASYILSLGLATEVPKLTHYGMVLFQTRA